MAVSPAVLKRIAKELKDIQLNPPEGISLIINEDDIIDVQAWIQGPAETPYHGGAFKVKLTISSGFPTSPPTGHFLTKIFHPNVAANGEICVSTLKKDWTSDVTISKLLLTIKCLLIYPNPESALNEEAGRLLLEDYESYSKHARLMTSIHASKGIEQAVAPSAEPSTGILTPANSGNISPQKRSLDDLFKTVKKTVPKADKKSIRRL